MVGEPKTEELDRLNADINRWCRWLESLREGIEEADTPADARRMSREYDIVSRQYAAAIIRREKLMRAPSSTREAETRKPSTGWKLSDEAARDIEAINRAIIKPGGFS